MSIPSTIVRAARKSRHLNQVELAAEAGVDQSSVSRVERGRDPSFSTLDRLLAASGHRLYAAPTRREDAQAVGAELAGALRAKNTDRALRTLIQFNDNLIAEKGLLRGVLCVAEPELTGYPLWDAALAGLVSWRLVEEGVPRPEWVVAPERFLAQPHTLSADSADPIPPAEAIPAEFAKRGVLVWRDTFESI